MSASRHLLATQLGRVLLRLPRAFARLPDLHRGELLAAGATHFAIDDGAGPRLDALRLPASPAAPRGLPVVLVHGWLERKEWHREAVILSQAGHEVVLFDQPAHSRSGGDFSTLGARERHDLRRVLDDAGRRGFLGPRVVTVGYSAGAATALLHAVDDPRVAAVAAFGPFVDLAGGIRFMGSLFAPDVSLPWVTRGLAGALGLAGHSLAEVDTLAAVRRLTVPVLFVAGDPRRGDTLGDQVKRLYDAKRHGFRRLVVIPGSSHFRLHRNGWPGVLRDFQAMLRAIPPRHDG